MNGDHARPLQRWWKDVVVYQVYPSSFKDSNGDGLGDLPGIISKLDHIRDLGVDVIWISPMYDSPMVDVGYDIRNYQDIYPPFGTLKDMDTLIDETHKRGMKIALDLVINHTSDQHEWFKESRSSKDNPKREWYMWRPARYDEQGNRIPPNNWRSNFSQPAWTWDEATQEYYLHLFCPEQPDLNWENPVTRKAIYANAAHFWMEKGVDGWRIDTVNLYSKGDLADVEVTDQTRRDQPAGHKYCNGPRIHEFLRELNQEAFQPYGDVMTVGEAGGGAGDEQALKYVRLSDLQLSMAFRFDVVDLGTGAVAGKPKFEATPYTLTEFKKRWTNNQMFIAGTDAWTTIFIENHDQGRAVSRFADDSPEFWDRSCKMLATLLAVSTGTLFIYQGQEIGMVNAPASWDLDEYLDVDTQNYIKFVKDSGSGTDQEMERVKQSLVKLARDHARIPMQWDDTAYAGFSTSKPWMRVHDRYKDINVATQEGNPESVLNYWRKALKMRKQHSELFVHGEVELIDADNEETFIFIKHKAGDKAGQKTVVALNFSEKQQEWNVPTQIDEGDAQTLICNYVSTDAKLSMLRPWEARVFLTS